MARRRNAAKRSSGGRVGGGGAPNAKGAIVFLALLAAVVGGVVLYKQGGWGGAASGSRTTPHPAQGQVPVSRTQGNVVRPPVEPVPQIKQETPPAVGQKSIQERLADIGPAGRARLTPLFAKAKVAYPPSTIVLVVLKKEKTLELWAGDDPENFRPITAYRVSDISGHAGPKLHDGDRQVPEGIYRVVGLNPNSKNILSLLLDYPNETDRLHARQDGRTDLGGELTIHGGESSVSSIPVGSQAIEELFTLAAESGIGRLKVVIMPCDLRKGEIPDTAGDAPLWTPELYRQIKTELAWMVAPGA